LYESEQAKATTVQTTATSGISVTSKFAGMNIKGKIYTEKEPTEKALFEYLRFKLSLTIDT
jgi:hypothetical protein